jgi:hypothetical protein
MALAQPGTSARLVLSWDAWKRANEASHAPLATLQHALEEDRCAADLLYATLFHPDRILRSGETVIDRVLQGALDMIAKKYAPDWERVRLLRDGRTYALTAGAADSYVKRFYWLCILHSQPELQELVRAAYVEGRHLWHTNREAHAHFTQFLQHLGSMIRSTLQWPCSVINITDVVRNFVEAARRHYVTADGE